MLLYIFISLHFNISILQIIDLITFIYGEIQKKKPHQTPPPKYTSSKIFVQFQYWNINTSPGLFMTHYLFEAADKINKI